VPQAELARLKAMPGVASVELDEYVENALYLHDSTPLVRGLQSQITGAGLTATGAGVRICVVDTGIDSDHVMYSTRIDTAAGRDFNNGDNNPEDDHGHGSHVSGIALGGTGLSVDFGCGAGSEPFQGMAPGATLIGCKVLNAAGGGLSSNIVAGINYCADQSPTGGRADVINMSIGTGNFVGNCTHAWAVAANNAATAGVVPVAASGNENNTNSMGSPACGVNVISVGATYKGNYPTCEDNLSSINWGNCVDSAPINTDEVVCFSNESDLLDVSAPGAIIWSASNAAGGGSIVGQAGTSMASPQVAGLAALILSVDPSLTPAQVRQIIRDGAIDLGAPGHDRGYGWGRIDAINSLQLAAGGGCTSNPECDDGLFCNGAETCDIPSGNCQAGTAPNCNDSVSCTTDSCNEGTDSCDHTPNNGACSDGLFCNGSETCNVTLGCQAGTAPNCADSVACTVDSCNEGTDSCDHTPNNGACSDGLFCNGSETCNVTLGCQAGTAPNCADSVACTVDSCNEGTDSCDHTPNNGACSDGLFCNGAETCNATLGCQAGSDPCPGQACDEGGDQCVACIVNGDCDDGLFCNGAETCSAGTCQAGTTPNCDDAVACTDDSCNEGTDSCDNVANNANCDDGLFCNGAETCSGTLGCQAGTDPCAPDPCDEGTDTCITAGGEAWVTFIDNATVPGVGTATNEDIVAYDLTAGTWSLVFDGSDVGLSSFVIDGLAVLTGGDILLSFTGAGTVGGVAMDDSDILRFTPTSLGAATAGTFTMYFDGSDVGLTTNNEDVDAISLDAGGNLVVSTLGTFSVTGASGNGEDMIAFSATSLGSTTAGTWAMLFDGSDVALSGTAENVDGAGITSGGTILLSTTGSFSVSGAAGANEDVFEFFPTTLGTTTSGTFAIFLDLSTIGIATGEDVGALELVE
ncbi:MAG: S8 family serine peptidase, partial [Phycisphaerales bacterium]|nr:S8 family serine peptidase [Phycisphaerales bacterium]